MAVLSVNLIRTISGNLQVDGKRTYAVEYLVETDDVDDQVEQAVTAAGIPSIGETYSAGNSSDSGAFVKGYKVNLKSQQNHRKAWRVVVEYEYSNSTTSSDKSRTMNPVEAQLTDTDPWDKPARISGSGVDVIEETQSSFSSISDENIKKFDIPIENSAHAINPVPTQYLRSEPSLTIEQDFLGWNERFDSYVDSVNDAEFFGKPAGEWRMKAPRWSRLFTGDGVWYYNLSFTFAYKLGGWNKIKVLDQGYMSYTPASGHKRVVDSNGFPLGGIALLDGNGGQLPAGWAPEYFPRNGVNLYRERNFGYLGIPLTRDGDFL